MVTAAPSPQTTADWLGDEANHLLNYEAKVNKSLLHLPGPDWAKIRSTQSG
ncbi:MAG: fructose-bisphosphate aldolase, partial [Cyanobacteria bacterium J06636_16]